MYESPSCFCACTPMCAEGCTSIGGSSNRSSVRPSFASTRSSIPSAPMSSTMNLSRAFTRDMRYFRSSLHTVVTAPRISFAPLLRHEDAEVARDARHRREAAADLHGEALAAVVHDADERDAVDLRRVAAVGAARDRVLVLARQVRPRGIAVELGGRALDDRRRVEELVGRETGDRAAGDVAHGVAAAAGARDARPPRGRRRRRGAPRARASAAGCTAASSARRRRGRSGSRPRRSRAASPASRIPLGIFTRSMNVPIFGLSW